jgi:hypothetical protein
MPSNKANRSTFLAGLGILTMSLGVQVGCSSQSAPTNIHAVHAHDVTTPGVVEAEGSDEAEVLKLVKDLKTGKSTQVGRLVVTAEAPYRAASGRTCRTIALKKAASTEGRLACTEHLIGEEPQDSPDREDARWVFVPTVVSQSVKPTVKASAPEASPSNNSEATAHMTSATEEARPTSASPEDTPARAASSPPEDRMP